MVRTASLLLTLSLFWTAPIWAQCPPPVDPTVEQAYTLSRNWCIPEAAPRCEFRFSAGGLSSTVEITDATVDQIVGIPAPTNLHGLGSIESQCFEPDGTPGGIETYVARFRGPRAPLLIP